MEDLFDDIYLRMPHYAPPKEYQEVIKAIRNDYARKSFGYDYNDLEQELWLKTYELLSTTDYISKEFLRRCLYNHIKDWFKKEIKYKKMFISRASFEGTSEEKPCAVSPPRPKIKGSYLKILLCAYHIYPFDLALDIRDYIAQIYTKLSSSELITIDNYANEYELTSKDKVSMHRILSKYSEL